MTTPIPVEKAWEIYARAARKRARMEADITTPPAVKAGQQKLVDEAFAVFRQAFERVGPAALAEPAPKTARSPFLRLVGRRHD